MSSSSVGTARRLAVRCGTAVLSTALACFGVASTGTADVTSVSPLERRYSSVSLHVLSADGSALVLQEGGLSGSAVVLQASVGAVAYHGALFVPLGQVPVGQQVTVWGPSQGAPIAVRY